MYEPVHITFRSFYKDGGTMRHLQQTAQKVNRASLSQGTDTVLLWLYFYYATLWTLMFAICLLYLKVQSGEKYPRFHISYF